LSALRQRGGDLSEGSPAYESVILALTNWLHERLPEERGGPRKKEEAEETIESFEDDPEMQALIDSERNPDPGRTGRVRRLLQLAKQRESRKQPERLQKRKRLSGKQPGRLQKKK
jgi:hypothetical protein